MSAGTDQNDIDWLRDDVAKVSASLREGAKEASDKYFRTLNEIVEAIRDRALANLNADLDPYLVKIREILDRPL
jgi:hypothetical protein